VKGGRTSLHFELYLMLYIPHNMVLPFSLTQDRVGRYLPTPPDQMIVAFRHWVKDGGVEIARFPLIASTYLICEYTSKVDRLIVSLALSLPRPQLPVPGIRLKSRGQLDPTPCPTCESTLAVTGKLISVMIFSQPLPSSITRRRP
jgi:hypothetical protein